MESPQGQALATSYRVRNHPTIVLLDAKGAVREQIFGIPEPEQLREAVQQGLTGE